MRASPAVAKGSLQHQQQQDDTGVIDKAAFFAKAGQRHEEEAGVASLPRHIVAHQLVSQESTSGSCLLSSRKVESVH